MRAKVEAMEVPHCLVPQCNGLVKPDIVFFGEALPEEFARSRPLAAHADLAIVMGSSLMVHPFATLPSLVGDGVPRVLINRERVGDLGSGSDDVLLLEDCDEGVKRLAEALGWWEELLGLWKEVNPNTEVEDMEAEVESGERTRDEVLNDEIEKLTREVDKSLKVSSEHQSRVNKQLGNGKGDSVEKEGKSQTENGEAPMPQALSGDVTGLKEDPVKADTPSSDLQHVFPHIDSKSSKSSL